MEADITLHMKEVEAQASQLGESLEKLIVEIIDLEHQLYPQYSAHLDMLIKRLAKAKNHNKGATEDIKLSLQYPPFV